MNEDLRKKVDRAVKLIQSAGADGSVGMLHEVPPRSNSDTQSAFARKPEIAVLGDYPTLTDINAAYGNNMAQKWLLPQLADLSLYTGAKKLL